MPIGLEDGLAGHPDTILVMVGGVDPSGVNEGRGEAKPHFARWRRWRGEEADVFGESGKGRNRKSFVVGEGARNIEIQS